MLLTLLLVGFFLMTAVIDFRSTPDTIRLIRGTLSLALVIVLLLTRSVGL